MAQANMDYQDGDMNYYTYIYFDPRNNLPFYIGKGSGRRFKNHIKMIRSNNHYNKHFEYKVKQIWNEGLEPVVRVVKQHDETMALLWEEKTIRTCKSLGIKLCNITSGGESGYSFSEEVKQKIREAQVKRWSDVNNRKKMSEIKKTQYRNDPDLKKVVGKVHIGNKYNLGRKHSDDAKQKIREANLGKKLSEETKLKMSIDRKGNKNGFYNKKHSQETIELLKTKCKHSEETLKIIGSKISKPVLCFDLNDNFICRYDSVKQAIESVGVDSTCITSVCKGKRKTAKKLKWQYAIKENI